MRVGELGGALLGELARVLAGVVDAVGVPVAVGDGVVLVPVGGLPRSELDLRKCAVGEVGADDSADRIVVDQRADALLDEFGLVFVFVGARIIGFVLADGVALVVEDRAAVADPPQIGAGVDEHGVAVLVEDECAALVALGREAGLGLGLDHEGLAGAAKVAVAFDPLGVGVAVGDAGA